jgi:hypothetical protein
MKKLFVSSIGFLLLISCTEQTTVDKPVADKWNGYQKFLKCGEKTKDLKDKNNNKVGTVKTGIDQDANFYVKYECNSGKELVKTNVYAGNKKEMPLSKPCDPKEDHFNDKQDHNNGTTNCEHKIPLCDMPPADDPGFVHAEYCKYKDEDGHEHDAWADGDKDFHDKGCGKYDDDYEEPTNTYTILYGTSYSNDSLKVYNLNMTLGTSSLILKEYVGNSAGTYDGTAFDVTSGMFFFTNYNTNELMVNNLKSTAPSFSAGVLDGKAASGTFYNGGFYYVDAVHNTINKVTFNTNWTIATQTLLDTIPSAIVVNDIAMSPAGDYLFMVGTVNGGNTELMSWQVATGTFYSMALAINTGAQITFGSDGILYAIAPITGGGAGSLAYTVDTASGTLTQIEDDGIIIIVDPFADISAGPIM